MKKSKKIFLVVIITLGCFILIGGLLFKFSKSRNFQFMGNLISRVETSEKKIALTFDDGPTENTSLILEKLNELDIKATFFLCGKEIEERKQDAISIVANGHEVGNHTYSHRRMILVSYDFCKEEIEKTDALIREIGYEGEIYFRSPYFKKLFILPLYLNNTNRTNVLCDVEPETALGFDATATELADYVVSQVESGSIILMHPMYNPDNILLALDIIVEELENRGYTFCTVEELLGE